MKRWLVRVLAGVGVVVLVAGWVIYFHNEFVLGVMPKWGWVQGTVKAMGQRQEVAAAADDDDPDNSKNEIPVHVGHVVKATLHRYVEGSGTVAARPGRGKEGAGSAAIAAPAAGVVAAVLVEPGQSVKKGDGLLQLDDRLAKATVAEAEAGVTDAQASEAALKAGPKAAQVEIAQLAVEKSQGALELAKKAFERAKALAADAGGSTKSVEQAASDVSAAGNDLATAQKQLELLRAGPAAQEVASAEAKVVSAQAALDAAKISEEMLTVRSPLEGTVMSVGVNPGEAVDATKTVVTVVALDKLMVDVDVPADEVKGEMAGLKAEVLVGAAEWPAGGTGEGVVEGKVAAVSPEVDARTGAVQVEIDLPADVKVRPGAWVRVRIVAEEHDDVLAAPEDSVVKDENGDWVIATVAGDQATHKSVKAGLRENGLVEIEADGLKEGDTLVTAGAYGLPAATRVKVVE